MAKIRHIAIFTEDPEELANFYVDTFGMTITQPLTSSPESGRWVFLTDGYIDMALIAPADKKDGANGINHFGFTMDEQEYAVVMGKLKARGITPRTPPADRPYVEERIKDIDGNPIDLSMTGLRARSA